MEAGHSNVGLLGNGICHQLDFAHPVLGHDRWCELGGVMQELRTDLMISDQQEALLGGV